MRDATSAATPQHHDVRSGDHEHEAHEHGARDKNVGYSVERPPLKAVRSAASLDFRNPRARQTIRQLGQIREGRGAEINQVLTLRAALVRLTKRARVNRAVAFRLVQPSNQGRRSSFGVMLIRRIGRPAASEIRSTSSAVVDAVGPVIS